MSHESPGGSREGRRGGQGFALKGWNRASLRYPRLCGAHGGRTDQGARDYQDSEGAHGEEKPDFMPGLSFRAE